MSAFDQIMGPFDFDKQEAQERVDIDDGKPPEKLRCFATGMPIYGLAYVVCIRGAKLPDDEKVSRDTPWPAFVISPLMYDADDERVLKLLAPFNIEIGIVQTGISVREALPKIDERHACIIDAMATFKPIAKSDNPYWGGTFQTIYAVDPRTRMVSIGYSNISLMTVQSRPERCRFMFTFEQAPDGV